LKGSGGSLKRASIMDHTRLMSLMHLKLKRIKMANINVTIVERRDNIRKIAQNIGNSFVYEYLNLT